MSGQYIPNIQIPQAVPIDVAGAMQRGQGMRMNALALLAQQRQLEQQTQQQNALAMYAGGLASDDPTKRMNTLSSLVQAAPGLTQQFLPMIRDERGAREFAAVMGGGQPAAPAMTPVASGGASGPIALPSTYQPPQGVDRNVDLMARTILGEAANQGVTGMAAVGHVIQNRARAAGMTPEQVVLAQGQFEPWGSPATRARLLTIDPNSPQYRQARTIAEQVLAGQMEDPTRGATHFFAPRLQAQLGRQVPQWAQGQEAQVIGDHNFYRLPYGRPNGATGTGGAGSSGGAGPGATSGASAGMVDPERVRRAVALVERGGPAGERAAQYLQRVAPFLRQETSSEMVPVPDPTSTTGFRYRRRATVDGAESPAPEGYRPNQQAFGGGENGLALQQIERLSPRVRSGQATPEEIARYQTAVTIAQQERIMPDGTRIIPRLPPYAVGLDELQRLYPPAGSAVALPAAPVEAAPATPAPEQPATPAAPPAGVPVGGTAMRAEPPPAVPGAGGGVIRAPRDVPQPIANAMLENVGGLNRAREALRLATQRPESFGFWRGVQNQIPLDGLNRIDPEGAAARAAAADIGSLRIHDRSGAAVTASEFPRLRPFIPQVGDDPRTVAVKLQRFVQEYEAVLRDLQGAYGPQQGYRPLPPVEEALRGPARGGSDSRPDPLNMRGRQ